MKEVRREFKQRVKEVNLYFDFLDNMLDSNVYLYFDNRKSWKKRPVNTEIQKILKANFFLILYNLTEASIRKSIQAIYDSMEKDGITYKLAKPEIQKVLLKNTHERLKGANTTTFVDAITNLLTEAIDDAVMKLDGNSIPIEGNLDARKVRELAKIYGFSHGTSKAKRGGDHLSTVKTQRNLLAHGNTSFSECGRNYTISELKDFKDEVIWFIEDILNNIKLYIDKKEYRAKK
jgi:hypothetical protein